MSSQPINVQFRGSRGYLHGTDLFTALLEATKEAFPIGEISEIRIQYRRFYRGSIRPEFLNASEIRKADWSCRIGQQEIAAKISEAPQGANPVRYPFEEHKLNSVIRFGSDLVTLKERCGFSPIEYVVFMAKALHLEIQPPAPGESWILSALTLAHPPEESTLKGLTIKIESGHGGSFTRSSVTNVRGKIGDIFFSKVASSLIPMRTSSQ